MRIALVCNDTRGGVQPYLALGLGLKRAGHDVRAVVPSDFAALFSNAGIPVSPLSGSTEAAVRGLGGVIERGALETMRFAARELPRHLETWTRETLAACEGAELMTGGVGGMVVGLSVAERLGIPFVETHLQPIGARSSAYPGVMFPNTPPWLGPVGLRLSHHLSELVIWTPFKRVMQTIRKNVLGLTGKPGISTDHPILYGFSPHIVKVPDTGPRVRLTTGYWTLPAPADWTPPPELEAFLARGGPVAAIGFGSMSSADPKRVTDLVTEALRKAGMRAVLLSGWGGLGEAGRQSDVFLADALPHDWLYPRVSAIVHHGGAGTAGAAFQSGVPSITVPFTMDQPFWGMRAATLGVGPQPIARKRLTAENLAAALRQAVDDKAMIQRAAALGQLLRAEDGVGNAVEVFGRMRGRGGNG
jgi:sterol 3beta-glucosyltransferase